MRELVLVQRGELRIVRAGARDAAVEEEATREQALARLAVGFGDARLRAHVVELRVLGLQTRVGLVDALRLDDRVAKRLEQRDATVLVGVGDVLGQRVDEELREVRFVALERALGRRDDDAIRRRRAPAACRRSRSSD